MTCLDVRRWILTNPRAIDRQIQLHLLNCPACGKAFTNASVLEKKLAAAFDVQPAPEFGFDPDRLPTREPTFAVTRRSAAVGGLAALAAAVAAVAIRTDILFPTLQSQVMPHLKPYTLASFDIVATDLLRSVLRNAGARLVNDLIPVTYAANCSIKSRTAAHIVVRTDSGPISVFLMPKVEVEGVEQLRDGPWTCRIAPFGQGSIALIGIKPEGIDAADKAVRSAVSAS
jgi:hypothetical protein